MPTPTDGVVELEAHHLSRMAGCASPGSGEAGREFLLAVRANVVAAWEAGRFSRYGSDRDADVITEIVDDAPETHTHQRWLEFVDLEVYLEGLPDGRSMWQDDLTEAAGEALKQVAGRLVAALLVDIREAAAELEDLDVG